MPEGGAWYPRGHGVHPFGRDYKSSFHPDYSDSCLRQQVNLQTNYPDKLAQPAGQWAYRRGADRHHPLGEMACAGPRNWLPHIPRPPTPKKTWFQSSSKRPIFPADMYSRQPTVGDQSGAWRYRLSIALRPPVFGYSKRRRAITRSAGAVRQFPRRRSSLAGFVH